MLGRSELIALIEKIKRGSYACEDDADADVDKLADGVLDPSAVDYLFQKECEALSPEEIADKILEYKPIRL